MDPQILAFVLLACGIILIFAELFIPSGGIIAVFSAACIGGAIYSAYQAWYGSDPIYFWTYVGSVIVLVPGSLLGVFRLLTRSAFGNRVLLAGPTEEEVTPYQRESEHLSSLIGKRGTALNLMTPGGLVRVGDERLHAISSGLMIEPNTEVEVIAVRGTRVVVEPVHEPGRDLDPAAEFEENDVEDPLDEWPDGERPGERGT